MMHNIYTQTTDLISSCEILPTENEELYIFLLGMTPKYDIQGFFCQLFFISNI